MRQSREEGRQRAAAGRSVVSICMASSLLSSCAHQLCSREMGASGGRTGMTAVFSFPSFWPAGS